MDNEHFSEMTKAIEHAALEATMLNGTAWGGFRVDVFMNALAITGYEVVPAYRAEVLSDETGRPIAINTRPVR